MGWSKVWQGLRIGLFWGGYRVNGWKFGRGLNGE